MNLKDTLGEKYIKIMRINKKDAYLSNYKKRVKKREEIETIRFNKGSKEEVDKKYLGY